MSSTGSPVGDPIEDDNQFAADTAGDDSDKESIISEIDDQELADYDADAAQLEDRPVVVDEDIARSLKASKKKRPDGEQQSRRPRERRRKKKRSRDGEESEGDGEGKKRRSDEVGQRSPEPEPEVNLTPEERRARALSRAIDASLKGPTKRRRKKDEVDLEDAIDEQLADLRVQMETACKNDNFARAEGKPATEKLRLLPDVVSMLNRDNAQSSVIDAETNFLQAVRFFLEPLDDGSLPAFNIQRDVLSCLLRLPIEKEALKQSGLGKLMLHYTKSKQPQPGVKRMAEKLVEEWSRPILKRSHDYRRRHVEMREFDPDARGSRGNHGASQITLTQRPAMSQQETERARLLAPRPLNPGRAQLGGLPATYTIAPKSTIDPSRGGPRPLGAGGIEAFRKMTQKKGRKG